MRLFVLAFFQIFNENEDRKSISVPIIDNNQFDDDTEFYIILKNPVGGKGVGDPSVATVTIFDDDGKLA